MCAEQRESSAAALRPPRNTLCIVAACTDATEAEQIARQLSQFDRACLVTYRRAEHLMWNVPAGRTALVVLATRETPATLRRMLDWLRRRWPHCPLTVVGDAGGGEHEMAAREGGACYLTRPVAPEEWAAVLSHALGGQRRVETREWHNEGTVPRGTV